MSDKPQMPDEFANEMRRMAEHGPEAFDVFSWSRGAPILVACYKHLAGAPMSDEETRLVREATRA